MKILVINPGSTSTKMAVYYDEKPILLRNITHTADELAPFDAITEQQDFRRQLVLDELRQADIPLEFDAVIGRGGLVKPISGGVYEINQQMIDDTLHGCVMHNHACNLGCLIAYEIAQMMPDCRSFIADPGVVDELSPLARISGSPLMPRICIWHALNQRAIARRYARGIGKEYEDLNLIICHLGGGISVAAHEHGRAIDANNALDGEGPFSPERAGSLPAADLIRLCFSGKYSEKQLLKRIAGKAGLNAHLGTNNMREILQHIQQGDKHAELIVDAMIYHVAKNIAAEAAVLCGNVDAILLTGGMAHSEYLVSRLRQRIDFLAPVYTFPGEDEMEALALNALAVLRGKREVKIYD
ncbi:butyrate kinase [Prevotellaceae bacterium HUN156]|jgi:butyrate kinase|nr:butyrate kinase [Prevotellaceae bacterium HUN156]